MVPCRAVNHAILAVFLIIAPSVAALEMAPVAPSFREIADGVHLLADLSCNIVVVTGPEGVLLIDSGYVGEVEQLKGAIAGLGAGQARVAINTHFHFDHIGANESLSRNGVIIIAHGRARQNMQVEWRVPENSLGITYGVVPAYPEEALPMLTFADAVTVHFGGHEIEVRHFPAAHSDSDSAVFLRDVNILHTGDLYLSNGFPIIDSFHGGTIDGLIDAVDTMIDRIDDDTRVVPGHGPVSNRRELRDYRSMLAATRNRIAEMIRDGKTLEETVAADPTAELYGRGESWLDPKFFVWTVYEDLTRTRVKEGSR